MKTSTEMQPGLAFSPPIKAEYDGRAVEIHWIGAVSGHVVAVIEIDGEKSMVNMDKP